MFPSYVLATRDLFSIERGILVHGCNCSGGFGSGVAGLMKKHYPIVEKAFRQIKPDPKLLGTIQVVQVNADLTVINGFTQVRFGRDGKRYADPLAIQSVLNNTLKYAVENDIDKIAMPKIGCNLGGLNWEKDVEHIVDTVARKADLDGVRVLVCDPFGPKYLNTKEYIPKKQ